MIQVVSPGLLTTVQDLGREGYGPLGVSPSGAADPLALRIGNKLVGNFEGAAALEMTLLGGTFLFTEPAVVALTGSDFGATLDGLPGETWARFVITAGQRLAVGPTRSGARCYLCVQGGILVKPFLGSASTHLLSGLGGFEGRALKKGDVLDFGSERFAQPAHLPAPPSPRKVLRVTEGPQRAWFPKSARALFYDGSYRVTEEANRMGLRLDGAAIEALSPRAMITEGVSLGAIQVTPSGQPIILFVEQQTTGGYPKIANVITADLWCVGQLRPRDEIRFELVDFDLARSVLREQERMIAATK